MKTEDVIYAILIVIIFLIMYAFGISIMSTAKIRDNWDVYKCNPAYMPFSKSIKGIDPEENMIGCMKNMSGDAMGYVLEPIEMSLDVVKVLIGTIIDTISDLQGFATTMSSSNISMFGSLADSIGGVSDVFSNSIDKLMDAIYRTTSIATVLQYMSQGVVLTAESLNNALCFHPNTLIKLQDGTQKKMKDVVLGDIIENGSIVEGTLQLNNVDLQGNIKNNFYKIKNNKNPSEDIYVTGQHLVFDSTKNIYLRVEKYDKAVLTNTNSKTLVCLITSDHRIIIGDQIFWDWEDEWYYK